MIVTCEECETQFQLDDSRVPAAGVRVRCSLCKHAFFVEPASDDAADDTLERAVRADLSAPSLPAPDEVPDPGAGDDPAAEDAGGDSGLELADSDLESDWEFNEDTPFGAADADLGGPDDSSGSPEAPPPQAAEPPSPGEPPDGAAPEASGDWFDREATGEDLGSPEEWDFFADDPVEARAAAAAAPAPRSPAAEQPGAGGPQPAGAADASTPDLDLEAATAERLARLRRVARAAGAAAAASLFAAGLYGGLRPQLAEVPPVTADRTVAGLDVEDVNGHWIENLAGGPLFVVSGTLRNDGPQPTSVGAPLALGLVDDSGTPVGASNAAVGRALPRGELRERSPAELRRRQEGEAQRFASRWLAPGARWRFQAIFEEVPPAARRLRFEPLELPESAAPEGA